MKEYLIADLFCGAGGSSTGAERAISTLGGKMILACVNHWPIAIETHQKNHPTSRHYLEDVTVADPCRIVPEGYLDLLMASPECTHFSLARGGKPVNNQSRMNPWAVHRWLTTLDVRCLLVENVPEFINWGPVEDGHATKTGSGLYFQAWIKALWEMGYKPEWRCLNSANYGDATTRTRFFLIARKDGKPVRWPAPTHSATGFSNMVDNLPKWRAAKEIIDWSNAGRSLLDDPKYRKHPLSEKTRRRIARGLEKFGGPLAPLYIDLLGLDADGKSGETIEPFLINHYQDNNRTPPRSTDKPIFTVTASGANYLIKPTVQPFVMGKQGHSPAYRSVEQPIPVVTCESASTLIEPTAEPFMLGQQSKSTPRKITAPVPTITTDGAISITAPIMVKYYGTGATSSVEKPLPTVTTKDRFGLVNPVASPFVLQNRIRPDGDRVYDIGKPLNTVTGHGAGALVNPLLVEVNHEGEERAHSIDDPLGTVTTKRGTAVIEPVAVKTDEDIDPRRMVLINGEPYLLDIRFRMLSNLELARAMGFSDDETTYEFVGNNSEVTKQIGNAVPVNMAKALVKAILE